MDRKEAFVDRLTAILVKAKVFSEKEARVYREQFDQSDIDAFDYFLLNEGLITKEDLLNGLSTLYQVPAVDVSGIFFDRELLRNFPKDFLLKNEMIPLEWEEDFLIMVAANPGDPDLAAKISTFVSLEAEFQVGIARDIIDAVEEYYDEAVTEVPEDVDLDEERRERDEFEKDGELEE